jgi:RHS repeat-associated protein
MSSSPTTPPIRSFQFGSTATASVKDSVNLFRGDVTLRQSLFTMPGRSEGQGLDVEVSLLYQSNVHSAAMTWNRSAPTGVVGLGWSLPVTSIEVDDGARSPAAPTYSYVRNGSRSPLAREPEAPFLFAMPAALAGLLRDGQAIDPAIVQQFGAHGLVLGTNAVAVPGSAGRWTLQDDEHQQMFTLQATEASLDAFDGGESYQLTSYDFSKILYYPRYERWTITSVSGTVTSFGGVGAPTEQGYATSPGNCIEWAVGWTAGDGDASAALWVGPSAETTRQRQFARAFRMARVTDLWGDAVTYAYNEQWSRDPATGLIPGVEQAVGTPQAPGLPYTKACYLTSITDVFGRRAVFQYEDKLWLPDPTSPREYADPHKAAPDDAPNAYQDRYETRYLRSIAVADTSGGALFRIVFQYAPRPGATDGTTDTSAVANVTGYSGALRGDTYKRFLTGIVRENGSGDALPGLVFDYFLDVEEDGAPTPGYSPGAIRSVIYPEGATAGWGYTRQVLTQCERAQTVTPPASVGASASPRVWFGSDYVVTTWYDAAAGRLSLQVFSWYGRWIAWSSGAGDLLVYDDARGLDPSTLQVVAAEDYFALAFAAEGALQVFVYSKDIARPGQFSPATIDGRTTGKNAPSLSYSLASATVQLLGGDSFLVVPQMDAVNERYVYDRVTWRWTTRSFSREISGQGDLPALSSYTWMTASGEYYASIDASGTARVVALTAALAWTAGGETRLGGFSAPQLANVVLVPGPSFVVLSQKKTVSPLGYTLTVLLWDAQYAMSSPAAFSFSDPQDPSGRYPTTWIPTVVSNTMIACAGNLLRFNGVAWLANSRLRLASVPSGQQQRYAYGPDYAVQVLATPGSPAVPTAKVLGFDPDAEVSAWSAMPVAPAQRLHNPPSSAYAAAANWPASGGGDYLTVGQYLYFRGAASDWGAVVQAPPQCDLQAAINQALGADPAVERYVLNTQAAVPEAPMFLAYFVVDTTPTNDRHTGVVVLQNGQVIASSGNPLILPDNEQISTVVGSGTNPGGPAVFAAFPGTVDRFTRTPSFTLYRYAGDQVSGAIVHYAVTSFVASNGFDGEVVTAIVPDLATAASDASGTVIKYYQTTVYPGSALGSGGAPPESPAFGSIVTNYLNGLEVTTGADYYDMLDGLLQRVCVRDREGETVAATTFEWEVVTARATDPADPSAPVAFLHGGFVVRTAVVRETSGVQSRVSIAYVDEARGFTAPWSAQPIGYTSTVPGSSGMLETWSRAVTYACELDGAERVFGALHLLSAQAQTVETWTREDGDPVPARASASTSRAWPCAKGPGVRVPAQEAAFSWAGDGSTAFSYSTYEPGQAPAGWQLASRITARTQLGLVVESEDALGVASSSLYSGAWSLPVAQVQNASLVRGEWAYFGFESYEDGSGWSALGTAFVAGDAWAGTRSLELPAGGGGSLSVAVTPGTGGQRYVLGFAVKTPVGFEPAAGSGWSIEVTAGASRTRQSAPFPATGGVWSFGTVGIAVPDGAGPFVVTVTASNAASQAVLLDAVSIAPLGSALKVQTFAPDSFVVTSSRDAGGRTSRTVYDEFHRSIASLDGDGQTLHVAQTYLCRQDGATAFDPQAPNASISLQPAGAGVMELFETGAEWQRRWVASAPVSDWRTEPGRLMHTTAAAGTLTFTGWRDEPPGTAALCFCVRADEALAGPVGVDLGDGYWLGWDPGAQAYRLTGPAPWSPPVPLGSPGSMARDWLVIFGEGALLFFADGQMIFSVSWARGVPASPAITTGPNALSFRRLGALVGPRVSVAFLDGSGNPRQTQTLGGGDATIRQTLVDALGRTVASTKRAPASFGADAALPLLAYHPSFVDARQFLRNTATSWELPGDVSAYYRGQTDGAVPRSDDQGYPYHGVRFEASPRPSHRLEVGQPGLPYAIHDVDTLPAATRPTQQYVYASTGGGGYFSNTVVSPLKATNTQVSTALRSAVQTSTADPQGGQTSLARTERAWSAPAAGAAAGSTAARELPNHFTASPQSDPAAYVVTTQTDALGQWTRRIDPDSGGTSVVYDPVGRVRFVQPALAPGEAWFQYRKYDPLGRLVEAGTVPQVWDEAQLRALAADPAWPGADVPHTVGRALAYDGDGDDPRAIGMLQTAVTTVSAPFPAAEACASTEAFSYDGRGNVSEASLAVAAPGAQPGTIRFVYNNLGQVVRLEYPAGSSLSQVMYSYDSYGRVAAIGSSPATPQDIAAYSYDAEGNVQVESLNGGALAVTYQYGSPGWLVRQAVTAAGASAPCWAMSYAYDADGSIQQRTEALGLGAQPGETVTSYVYDAQRRLLSATVAGGGPGSESIAAYDANGNIWEASADGVASSFACVAGADRLGSVALGGAAAVIPGYTADGRLSSCGALSVRYDASLGLPSGFAMSPASGGEVQIQAGYGAAGQRTLLRDLGGATRIYHCGDGTLPLALADDGTWTALIHGPTGVVAIVRDHVYFPLKDPQGTVHAVLDAAGQLVARYRYLAFGLPLPPEGPRPEVCPYRFMGQEWDAATGLYNFIGRMYNPALRRFHEPDPARQFASPYVFVGNDPVSMVDPDGQSAIWAQITTTVLMIGVTVGGVALSLFTGGASDAVAAEVDADLGLMATGEGAEKMVDGGIELSDMASLGEDGDAAGSLTSDTEIDTGSSTGAQPVGGASGESQTLYGYFDYWNDRDHIKDTALDSDEVLRFRDDFGRGTHRGRVGGITESVRVPGSPWYAPRYSVSTTNFMNRETNFWAWQETRVHEGFHAMVSEHFPRYRKLSRSRVVGAPLTLMEEVGAYSSGCVGSLRFHKLLSVPRKAYLSTWSKWG